MSNRDDDYTEKMRKLSKSLDDLIEEKQTQSQTHKPYRNRTFNYIRDEEGGKKRSLEYELEEYETRNKRTKMERTLDSSFYANYDPFRGVQLFNQMIYNQLMQPRKIEQPIDKLMGLEKSNFPVGTLYPDGCEFIVPKINGSTHENYRLLSSTSVTPKREDIVKFDRICDAFILGFVTSDIWQISKYDLQINRQTTALYSKDDVLRGMQQHEKFFIFVDFSGINIVEYEGYRFRQERVIDNKTDSKYPILHSRFHDILNDHYTKIAKQIGYTYVVIRGKFSHKNKHIMFVEIMFYPKNFQ